MNEKKPENKLNLEEKNIKAEPKILLTPEQMQQKAAETMGTFYHIVGNTCLNIIPILESIKESFVDISNDSASLLELEAKRALKDEVINPVEFEEMMKPANEEPPPNSEKK